MNNTTQKTNNYAKATLWFIAALFIGCGNDAVAKHLSTQGIDNITIAFFRLAIGALSLIPLLLGARQKGFPVQYPSIHALRGVLTFLAIFLWISGVSESSIVTATLVNFTMPIFALLLAPWLLHEKKNWSITAATLVGFIGTLITLYPAGLGMDAYSTFFIIAMICFVILDILAKKYASQESILNMLFYANLMAALCAFAPFAHQGVIPPKATWPYLGLMGLGGNLLLYCLLKAYQHADLIALAPLRYLELVISIVLNYLCFYKTPTWYEWIGSLVIIPTSFFVIHQQKSKQKETSSS